MRKATIVFFLIAVVIGLMAQVSGPSQITLKPIAASTGCVADPLGDVLCGASDGFYISVAGGAFQKLQTGAPPTFTKFTCTTATLSAGTTGTLTTDHCTFQ